MTRALFLLAASSAFAIAGACAENPGKARFGLHWSEVDIQGDHLKDVESLFKKLKYVVIGKSWVTGWNRLNDVMDKQPLSKTRVKKAVYLSHGWTHIVDLEFVMFTEEKILAKESQALHAKIMTWSSESTSDSYGFSFFENGRMVRSVLNFDGKSEATGTRLAAEQKIVWKDAGEDEILELVNRLGPGFDEQDEKVKFQVYDLKER